MYIGKKLKELRKDVGLTLVQLSGKSGVQVATLSRIENMKMTGSLESHINIAKALGIDVTQLYSDLIKEERKIDVRTGKVSSDVFVHSDKSSYEILTSKVLSKKMMPILLKIEANGTSNSESNKLGSEKFVFVLEGSIEVLINDDPYPLSKGNSLYFDSSVDHRFVNKGKAPAKILCVTTPVNL